MIFLAHIMLGWIIANYSILERRDRLLAVIAANLPDLDSAGYLADPSYYYSFHHEWFHSILFCVAGALLLLPFSKEKVRGGAAFLAAGLSHLLADLVGTSWGMPFLWPVSNHHFDVLGVFSEWAIYHVIDPVAFVVLAALTFQIMVEFRRTPLEMVSVKHDERLVRALLFWRKDRRPQ